MAPGSICVLGGSGFVGTHLCAALARDGWRIVVPTRDPFRARHLAPVPALKLVAADIHDARQLAALCAGQRAVVNLVGILNERGRSGRGFQKVHVELPRKLVEACVAQARTFGYKTLTLWTNDILHTARRIYEAQGFTLVKEERHHSFGKDLVGQYWRLAL